MAEASSGVHRPGRRTSATRATTCANAVRALAALPGVRLRGVSPLYRTKPVGVTDQPDFLNAVVALDVPAGPDPETGALALLAALKRSSRRSAARSAQRWGPREIDLDLLVFGRHRDQMSNGPTSAGWRCPIRRLSERLFVLAPLADLAPGLVPPGWRESVETRAPARSSTTSRQNAVQVVGTL